MGFVSSVPAGLFLLDLWAATCCVKGKIPIFPSNKHSLFDPNSGLLTAHMNIIFEINFLLLHVLCGSYSPGAR